jgi:hypothetical protein
MNGEQMNSACKLASIDGVRKVLSTSYLCNWLSPRMLHQVASDMNKSKRQLPPNVDITYCLEALTEILWQVTSYGEMFEIGSP